MEKTHREIDLTTGKQIDRVPTQSELLEAALAKEAKDLEIAALAAQEAARAALLNKLGITADEAKLLLG